MPRPVQVRRVPRRGHKGQAERPLRACEAARRGAGKAGTLGNAVDEIAFLQPLTVVASTADRLLTVTDDVRGALDGYELKVGGCHVEPLRLSYSSGLLRDDQVDIPAYGHLFYSVDMWQVAAFKRFA